MSDTPQHSPVDIPGVPIHPPYSETHATHPAPPDVVRDRGLSPETAPGLQFTSSLNARRPLHKALATMALLVILLVAGFALIGVLTNPT